MIRTEAFAHLRFGRARASTVSGAPHACAASRTHQQFLAVGSNTMVNAPTSESASSESLQGKPVYIMAAVCLALGLVAGYLFGGLHTSASGTVSAAHVGHAGAPASVTRMPTLDDMKRMADKQAAPLLARLSR